MKLAFHSATTMTSDLQTDIAAAGSAGFRALELWAAKLDRYLSDHTPLDLQHLFAKHNVEPLAISSIEFIAFRGDQYSRIRDRLHELGAIARQIGCGTVVVVPSPLPDRNLSWASVRAEYVEVLCDLSAVARPYGVRLAFEPLGFGWCSVRTPRAALEILNACACDNLGLALDAAHFWCSGARMQELDRLEAGQVIGFHLDDLEDTALEAVRDDTRLLPGLGVLPLDEICSRLQRTGYDGPCSVETFRPEYWEWDPGEVARQAHAAALKILSPHFQIE